MKLKTITLSAVLAAAIGIAHAQSGGMKGMDMKDMDMKGMEMNKDKNAAAGKVHKASGKVTKVDPAKGTVTIAHGPVPSMSWPSMTMSFKVKDKAMLGKVKNGDQVDFSFVQSGKDHTITAIK
jgi:Cu(I)/Ag(I) efflux system periplasmic protein CusF